MKYIFVKFSCLLFVLILGQSCKSKKSLGAKLPNETAKAGNVKADYSAFFENIKQRESNYEFISWKGECEFNDSKNNYNLDLQLEMEKGKFIFIRATYLLGIEVAKIYITPTQIQILNHIEKINTLASFEYLKKFSSANLQFENIENILLGNAIFSQQSDITMLDSNETQYILKTLLAGVSQQCYYGINKIAKLQVNQLEDSVKNQNFEVKYHQYIENGTNYYPSELAINIRAEKNLGCSLKLFNFAFDKKREPQIRVPASYKTVNY